MRLTQIIAAAAIALVSTFAVADDAAEQTIRKSLANLLRSAGFETLTFAGGAPFLASERAGQAGCVLLDLKMPGMSGLDTLEAMARFPRVGR